MGPASATTVMVPVPVCQSRYQDRWRRRDSPSQAQPADSEPRSPWHRDRAVVTRAIIMIMTRISVLPGIRRAETAVTGITGMMTA